MLSQPRKIAFAALLAAAGLALAPLAQASAATAGQGNSISSTATTTLTSGKPVNGSVAGPKGVTYKFTAVTGHHVTLALTSPHTAPPGARLQMNVYDSSGAEDAGTDVFSTGPTDINFTPTADEAGATKVVITPWDTGATGKFTLTYANDVTGTLTAGVAKKGTTKFEGQDAVYTFKAVTGHHVTVALTSPHTAPSGARLQLNVYDSSGAQDGGTDVFSSSPGDLNFTPTRDEAGTTYVVVSPWDGDATGSFTLTYANDIGGKLTSGKAKKGTLRHEGQNADYTFTAVKGKRVTISITRPHTAPGGARLQLNVYDSSGAQDTGTDVFSTSKTSVTFTPTGAEAGRTTIVISPWDGDATGSFTITYKVR